MQAVGGNFQIGGAGRVQPVETVGVFQQGVIAALALDLTELASIDAFFDACEDALGAADVLVNNAGVCVPGLLHEVGAADLQLEIATNLVGPALLARRMIASLRARDSMTTPVSAARSSCWSLMAGCPRAVARASATGAAVTWSSGG